MLNIIYDPNKLYPGYSDIVVKDTDTYIRSQILIGELKENKRNSLYIVVTRPSYIKYYKLYKNVASWSNISEYTFDNVLAEIGIEFTEIENKKIGILIPHTGDRVKFFKEYNTDSSLEGNLLKHIFHNGEDISSIEEIPELFCWIENSLKNNRAEWVDREIKQFLIENLDEDFDIGFLNILLSNKNIKELENFRLSIVSTFMFKKYPNSSKNVLKNKFKILDKNYISEEYMNVIVDTNPVILEEINLALSTNRDLLSIFETSELDYFLGRTTGYLEEEWNWVWDYIKINFYKEDFSKELSKICHWTKTLEGKKNTKLIMDLLEFSLAKKNYLNPIDIDEWYEYYQCFYLEWFSTIDQEKDLLRRLYYLQEEFLSSEINNAIDYKRKMDRKYEKFLYNNFPQLIAQKETNLKIIEEIQKYVGDYKVFFFVIDNLRWELWDIIKSIFEGEEYFIENEKQSCLSMLPSITSISRTSLITGRSYSYLVEEKMDKEYSFNILNEEKHLKRDFSNYSIVYKNGGLEDILSLLEENADIYVLVYSQADAIFHATSQLNKEALESVLKDLIHEIIEKINQQEEMIIVIGTDHGSVSTRGREKVQIDELDGIEIEQHGNCLKLHAPVFNRKLYENVKKKTAKDNWYAIWREDSFKYGLPESMDNTEIYGWLFPKGDYYYGTKPKGFVHGGLSMEETIVPYGIFRRQIGVLKDLIITVGEKSLFLNELSYLELFIYNPNNFGIKNIDINLPNLDLNINIKDLQSRTKRKIRLEFVLEKDNCTGEHLREDMELNLNYLGNTSKQYYKINEEFEEKTVSSISKEVSEKRTLDF